LIFQIAFLGLALLVGTPVVLAVPYTDRANGIFLDAPEQFVIRRSGFNRVEDLTAFSAPPIAYIDYRQDRDQLHGFLLVERSAKPEVVRDCLNPQRTIPAGIVAFNAFGDGKLKTEKVAIAGTTFVRVSIVPETGAGVDVGRAYLTRRGDTCYAIQITVFPTACLLSGCEDRRWTPEKEVKLLSELDAVARTIRLLN
jgi:hypothetical protein